VIKSSRKKFAEHRARLGSCIVVVPEEKETLGSPRCTWENNFKMKFSNKISGPGLIIYLLAYKD
jgi:hypothetical protein